MYKRVKLTTEKGNVFFAGCVHYGHDKEFLWGKRGFKSVQEHDEYFINVTNTKTKQTDTLFLLGDTIFGPNKLERLTILLRRLNPGTFYLLPGNHQGGYYELLKGMFGDGDFINIDKFGRVIANVAGKVVYLVSNYFEIVVNNQEIVLSHYPIRCFNHYARLSWMVHSHVHGNLAGSLPTNYNQGKVLDCGAESVREPLSFDEIKVIMDKKQVFAEDHHGKELTN